ncbi:DUF2391 domain-containing protein [Halorussus gelatinilyticus]|uniref:DUF2391 domain-containing protein n=1 Tax=Halorussus gelatinilyticus TaxID=2937524 RepID=A0A8U0IH47_9EURY|nr:DUF2391 domain-containing protein [Halorussus gelatinilyticus]UPW00293.1 DUF2391 domain-containing protein [Halorussus gelatinilyticus]
MSDRRANSGTDRSESEPPADPDLEDLLDELETLEETVDDPDEREQVRETMRMARRVSTPSAFGRVIRGFDRHDAAEALVGSVVFGIPMLVEGGTVEIGEFIAAHPASLLVTLGGTVALVVGLLYVAEIQQVEIHRPLFGVVPRRLVGVLGVSFLTALGMMTVWGRVDWADPWLALCQTSVTFSAMALGAGLGDILPGS